MTNFLYVALGGGLGAGARYVMVNAVHRYTGSSFPYGTLVVNVVGCLLIGILMGMFEDRFLVNPGLRLFLTVGILGGFTTFSTFSYETMMLFSDGEFWNGGLNIILSLFFCLGATYLGLTFGKLI